MELDSVARRRSARTARRVVARVASAPATSSPGLGWRPWASLLCHSALLAVFAFVWLWHFVSPAAASLPGYKGFGRFARFLTFCSFTWQLVVWTLAVVTDVATLLRRAGGAGCTLSAALDDAACAALPIATAVTMLYYALLTANPGFVEEPGLRPVWLSPTMHLGNSASAWADVLLCAPRSFSDRAARLSLGAALAYAVWIQVVKAVSGAYPYPVLNQLPHPHGFFGLLAAAMVVFGAAFATARALTRALRGIGGAAAAPQRRRKAA